MAAITALMAVGSPGASVAVTTGVTAPNPVQGIAERST
jgi:hypothetical protein